MCASRQGCVCSISASDSSSRSKTAPVSMSWRVLSTNTVNPRMRRVSPPPAVAGAPMPPKVCRNRRRKFIWKLELEIRAVSSPGNPSAELHEAQGDGVNAISEPGRLGPVIEEISEVRVTTTTRYFTFRVTVARHAVSYVLLGDRLPEARPTGARIKLDRGCEQRGAAAHAPEHPAVVEVPVGAGECPFGAVLTRDLV